MRTSRSFHKNESRRWETLLSITHSTHSPVPLHRSEFWMRTSRSFHKNESRRWETLLSITHSTRVHYKSTALTQRASGKANNCKSLTHSRADQKTRFVHAFQWEYSTLHSLQRI
ncbi:hypothetical protein PO909_011495 [Leuciscus waleckii]